MRSVNVERKSRAQSARAKPRAAPARGRARTARGAAGQRPRGRERR